VRGLGEIEKFWNVLDPLDKNEVYVLLLIGKKRNERQILDTVLIKSNSFDEFFNKTSILLNKARRIPFDTELLMDINKKNVVEGLENGWIDIRGKINRNEDIRNFFSIFLRNIRYAQVTNYVLLKDTEPLYEIKPEYIVRAGKIYYHILREGDDDCIKKPEIPIPGTFMNGEQVVLHYVNGE
jgi:hypothetical protein